MENTVEQLINSNVIPLTFPCLSCGDHIPFEYWYEHVERCLSAFDWSGDKGYPWYPCYQNDAQREGRFVSNMFDHWKDRDLNGVIAQHEIENNGAPQFGSYAGTAPWRVPLNGDSKPHRPLLDVTQFSKLAFNWD